MKDSVPLSEDKTVLFNEIYESLIEQEYADRPNSISKKLILLSDRERILKFAELVYAKGADNIPEPDSQTGMYEGVESQELWKEIYIDFRDGEGWIAFSKRMSQTYSITRKSVNKLK